MNGITAKAIRNLCYAGVESHGYSPKSRQYSNAFSARGFFHTNKPALGGRLLKIEPLQADQFRKMYQRIKREFTRGIGGWEELIANEIQRLRAR